MGRGNHGVMQAVARARVALGVPGAGGRLIRTVRFKSVQPDRQLAYGIVYEPNVVDTHGEYMTADEIEKMAHRFLLAKRNSAFDVMHDNIDQQAHVVESFIARAGDPDYPVGAWVAGVWVPNQTLWARIRKGEITGFSFEALVTKHPRSALVDEHHHILEVA